MGKFIKPKIQTLLDLVEKYRKKREENMDNHFSLSVLDGVHIDENAHTRLLMYLLKNIPVLSSFLDLLKRKNKEFGSIKIHDPKITIEKYRIDGLIHEEGKGGKYAIIFENKVCGAIDQERQLERYIDICKSKLEYDDHNIYILYLVDRPGKEPSNQTWGKYQEKFKSRYLILSYSDDIISWLEKLTLPNSERVKEKENIVRSFLQDEKEILRSRIIQYILFLKELFRSSKYTDMKIELLTDLWKDLVSSPLSGGKNDLKEKLQSIDELRSDVEKLLWYSYIKDWENKIKTNYDSLEICSKTEIGEFYPQVGVKYEFEKLLFDVLIEFDIQRGKVCLGLWKKDKKLLPEDLKQKMEGLKIQMAHDSSSPWHCWRYVKPDEAMAKFDELVRDLEDIRAKKMALKSEEE